MKVLITGATGLVGKELCHLLLQQNIQINYLTTSKSKIENNSNFQGFYWNPAQAIIDENCMFNVTAIIHLAGASISKRWTTSYKQEIIESRVESANLLFLTLKNHPNQVEHFISASAIGIYPDSLNELYSEDFTNFNNSFLSNVVVKWEEAAEQFKRLKIIVSKVRIGLVLSSDGGALVEIVKPIRLGFGSAFGSGKHWQSWIHVHDVAQIFEFIFKNKLEGIFNAVAPNPVINSVLISETAKTLKKPFFFPNVPKFVMKLILGEMHTLLYESQNVSSKKIQNKGFVFKFESIHKALNSIFSNISN
jgi:uncharacterized protein